MDSLFQQPYCYAPRHNCTTFAEGGCEKVSVDFNGKDLTGVGDTKDTPLSSNMVCKPGGNIYTKEYSISVPFEFQLTPGANNGGIRAPLRNAAYAGWKSRSWTTARSSRTSRLPAHGSIYGVVPAKRDHLKPVGEWNTEEITAKGNQVTVVLNGVNIVDADVAKASENGTLDGEEHPGLKNTKGHISFLGHGDRIAFRNLRVKDLSK